MLTNNIKLTVADVVSWQFLAHDFALHQATQ